MLSAFATLTKTFPLPHIEVIQHFTCRWATQQFSWDPLIRLPPSGEDRSDPLPLSRKCRELVP